MKFGKIKWFDITKGFGFIEDNYNEQFFVHITNAYEGIKEGDVVGFELQESKKGKQAIKVTKMCNW